MASKKTTTQTNTPAYITPPPTQATTNLQNMVDTGGDTYSQPLRNSYARAEKQLDTSYNNPLGAYGTADVTDKARRSQHLDLQQSLGMDLSNAAQAAQQNKFSQQATVAGLTAPQMYNAKSVGVTSDPWGNALGVAGLGTSLVTGGLTGSRKV